MSNEIIKAENRREISLYDRIDDPIAAVETMGNWLFKSGLFGISTPAAGAVAAMACMAERKNPLELARQYHFIEGQLSMKAEAILANFNERGGKHRIIQRDGEAVEVELTPAHGDPIKFRLTWDEAKQESYVYQKDGKSLKTNYSTPRRRMQMMWARVVSDAVRAIDPGVVVGTYTPEEVEDFDDRPQQANGRQTQDDVARRRAELEAMDAEIVGEPRVPDDPEMHTPDRSAEPAKAANSQSKAKGEPEPEPAAAEIDDEPAPDECSRDQLQTLLDLATECGIDKPTLREKCLQFAKVSDPTEMTAEQADELIGRLKLAIEKKRSSST